MPSTAVSLGFGGASVGSFGAVTTSLISLGGATAGARAGVARPSSVAESAPPKQTEIDGRMARGLREGHPDEQVCLERLSCGRSETRAWSCPRRAVARAELYRAPWSRGPIALSRVHAPHPAPPRRSGEQDRRRRGRRAARERGQGARRERPR